MKVVAPQRFLRSSRSTRPCTACAAGALAAGAWPAPHAACRYRGGTAPPQPGWQLRPDFFPQLRQSPNNDARSTPHARHVTRARAFSRASQFLFTIWSRSWSRRLSRLGTIVDFPRISRCKRLGACSSRFSHIMIISTNHRGAAAAPRIRGSAHRAIRAIRARLARHRAPGRVRRAASVLASCPLARELSNPARIDHKYWQRRAHSAAATAASVTASRLHHASACSPERSAVCSAAPPHARHWPA